MKELYEMTLEELWELFPIVLTPPSPSWKLWFEDEKQALKKILTSFETELINFSE